MIKLFSLKILMSEDDASSSIDFALFPASSQFVHCRALRLLYSNQLTGTLPLVLTNLFQLQELYARNRIILLDNSCLFASIRLCADSLIVVLSGT